MKNKILIPSILFAVVAIFAIIVIIQNDSNTQQLANNPSDNSEINSQEIILFYGDDCPHCVIVEEFLEQNDIETNISFVKKEVYYNNQNANDLVSKAQICKIPTNSIGVPFLWDGSNCFVGDREIIGFFKLKANIQ